MKDADLKTSKVTQTLDVVLKGGPLARGAELIVDGEVVPKVTRAVIDADVNDAIRLRTEQILIVANVNVTAASWEKRIVASVHAWDGEGANAKQREIKGVGDTAVEALEDAVRQLKEGS